MDAALTIKKWMLGEVLASAIADKADSTSRRYVQRIRRFAEWLVDNKLSLSKQSVGAFRRYLAGENLTPSTINGHLSAIKLVVRESAAVGLLTHNQAEHICSIESVRQNGHAFGNWLSQSSAQSLLDAPNTDTLRGLRDQAILSLMLFCGLRRSEVTNLTIDHLQERDNHNVILNLIGKHGRIRTLKIPVAVRRSLDTWLSASGRELTPQSRVFVAMAKGGKLRGPNMSDQAIYKLIQRYGRRIGCAELRPHDLRRTFARLSRDGGARLEQISLTLGHSRLETTQRYLGTALDLDHSAPDAVSLKLNGTS